MASIKYKCVKCGAGQTEAQHPLIGRCNKGGGHEWIVEDGVRRNYRCIKCGSGISASSHPLLGCCSKGDGHDWKA